ncbi:MAG TPA: amidohydrolase family protein [Candidatus Sulfotelmatobacter sp.]|nr:amidohydrolase family protein [Candidatus Sulfotelmatobacter sp.]
MNRLVRPCAILLFFFSLIQAPSSAGSSAKKSADKKAADTASKDKDKKEDPLPLKPARKIEFTTQEGTWLSLDVSPDGQTIVFDLVGDIYTVPIAGGEAKKVSSGMAFNNQPHFSPDGKKIAYVSDAGGSENVWIADVDGKNPKQLSQDEQSEFTSPVFTPDGNYVIAGRTMQFPIGASELWMYHVRGGAGVQVTKSHAKPDARPRDWNSTLGASPSRDGRYLYYATRHAPDGFYNVKFPLSQITRRDLTTGDEDPVTDAPGSAMSPLISPDGNLLVYATRYETETGFRIRDLKNGEEHWLKYPVQRDDQESLFTRDFMPNYAFTPDGKQVIAAWGGKIHSISVATSEDRVIPFTAKISRDLGPDLNHAMRVEQGAVKLRLIQQPAQSPDGKHLAFSALTHIYVMDLPSGTPRRLTQGNAREFQPAWSPDGSTIAYVTWEHGGGQIWKTQADGQGTPRQLTSTPAYYRDVAWSPEADRIVALRAPRQARLEQFDEWDHTTANMDLIWLPADGGDVHLILPARGAGRPHFGPERDRIYLYSDAGLVSLRYDGTDRRALLKVVGKTWFPDPDKLDGAPADDVHISPDGAWALARVSNQVYLMAAPRIGGDAPTVDVFKSPVPIRKVTEVGGDYMGWADGGKTIVWAEGSTFFRLPLSQVEFEPPKKPDEESKPSPKDSPKPSAKTASAAEPPASDDDKKDDKKKPPKLHPEEIAVNLEFPRHTPSGTAVLRGARVITMHGDEILDDADIVVRDNRIVSVGKHGSANPPADAKVIDVSGKTIVPGFIDLHPHWNEIRRVVMDTQNWSFLANLAYGVTAGRDPQTATNDMFAYQDLVDTGEILGPRAYSTGPGVFPDTNFESLDDAKAVVSRYIKFYRTPYLKSYLVGNRKQRQWMVMACKELGVMPTTEGGLDMKLNLTHAIDGFSGNEHSMPITPLFDDIVQFWTRSGIFYTPTFIVAYGGPFSEDYFYETTEVHDDPKVRHFIPHNMVDDRTRRRGLWTRKDELFFPRLAAEDNKLIKAGGHVQIGSHGQFQGLGYHWEMWSLASGGVSNMEVLKSATIHGAEAIGLAQDLGSIEPGKLADLVVLDKNPLDDIRNTNTIQYVMKNGELFEGNTLNEVYPEQKPLAPLWWWDEK